MSIKVSIADGLAAADVLSERELCAALDAWCNSRVHQTTITAGDVHVDLDV